MGKTRRWAPRKDPIIEGRMRTLVQAGLSAAEIQLKLSTDPETPVDKVPSERTIRDRIKRYRPKDTSSRWSLAEAEPEEAALVLPMLAEAIECGFIGPVQSFTVQERVITLRPRLTKDMAAWIVKVRLATPDMPLDWVLEVMQTYRWHVDIDEPTEGLDQMLAFAPWRDEVHLYRYLYAVHRLHPDWFDAFDLKRPGGPNMKLAYDISWKPEAAGLFIVAGRSDIEIVKGPFDD